MNENYLIPVYNGSRIDINLRLPGSKSLTNRALILSSLAGGKTCLENMLVSEDTVYMYKALNQLGMKIRLDESAKICEIEGGKKPAGNYDLYTGNAGTAMRFLTSYLALGHGFFTIDGDNRMRERPIEDLLKALRQLGCDVSSKSGNGCPPVIIRAEGILGGECNISGKNSSQYISSLLMAAPYSRDGIKVKTSGDISSKPYIDMTIGIMSKFGVEVKRDSYKEFIVHKSEYQSQTVFEIEPDASSASYFLAAVAILSGRITIEGLGKNSFQGDIRFAEILKTMGCIVYREDDYTVLESNGKISGVNFDMNECPDLVPALAVIALFAETPTYIRNVANLRIKESDRINALCIELKKLGAEIKEYEDGLEIFPKKVYNNALINTYNDHRIAMAFSIAGLKIPGVEISNPACVSKSFPDFFTYLNKYFI